MVSGPVRRLGDRFHPGLERKSLTPNDSVKTSRTLERVDIGGWDIYKASAELWEAWTERIIRNGMKIAHPETVPRFDGKTADGSSSLEQAPEKDKGSSRGRKRAGTDSRQSSSNKKNKDSKGSGCWACGGKHPPATCVLLTGKNPKNHNIFEDNKKRFDDNMKDGAFKRDVEAVRSGIQSTNEISRRRRRKD